jgi:hypothetical protein
MNPERRPMTRSDRVAMLEDASGKVAFPPGPFPGVLESCANPALVQRLFSPSQFWIVPLPTPNCWQACELLVAQEQPKPVGCVLPVWYRTLPSSETWPCRRVSWCRCPADAGQVNAQAVQLRIEPPREAIVFASPSSLVMPMLLRSEGALTCQR